MSDQAPWYDEEWSAHVATEIEEGLAAAGVKTLGPPQTIKSWARACLLTVETDRGSLWVKYAYRLPPGEEHVLATLATRHATGLPRVISHWDGAVVLAPLPGQELTPEHPLSDWEGATRTIATIQRAEIPHADAWLELGVRDRRPPAFADAVIALAESETLDELPPDVRGRFEELLPAWVVRYRDAFTSPATLVHQDSGCCNIHVGEGDPVLFDWTDVVVGHTAFSVDRLLDQVPAEHQDRIIDVYAEASGVDTTELRAMRRSNVLHEVLRYHDELEHISPDDQVHTNLSRSVRNQIQVLVAHEDRR